MNANKILYDYITERYGSVVDFSNESGIPLIDLTALLLKDNVSKEIYMGLDLCRKLGIDIKELVFNGQIKESERAVNARSFENHSKTIETSAKSLKNEIYRKSMRLSEQEKILVLKYIDSISGETDGST